MFKNFEDFRQNVDRQLREGGVGGRGSLSKAASGQDLRRKTQGHLLSMTSSPNTYTCKYKNPQLDGSENRALS